MNSSVMLQDTKRLGIIFGSILIVSGISIYLFKEHMYCIL